MIYFLGGTVVAALELLKKRGVDNKQIKVVSKWNLMFTVIYTFPIVLY